MNLLSTILDRLNQRIEVGNIFDQIYGLSELVGEGNDKAWAFYIGNGQAIPVTNFDAKQGTLFWAKRGKITVNKNESLRLAGCKSIYETRFSMTAYAMVRKSHLPCDSADAQDWVASRVLRLISGTDPQFKTAIGVVAYEVVPNGYATEARYLPVNYEWAAVAIDVDVNVSTTSEDGCYDTCATGDIPLPDFEPCEPCLTSVAVDGVTITGNGTPADPLVAVGGGGGGSLTVRDEGTVVATGVVNMNFRGGAVNANSSTPGSVNVDVQEVQLTAGTGISVSGTYPSLTITNTAPSSGGTVTNVTGTAPIASSGGNTPDISISQAGTASDGYLSSADWNTFNNKGNGTVTSVAATVPNPTNPAFSVTVPNNTTTPSVDITANGVVSQYVRGDGSLANFPASFGGGASVSYYLNGSINQGTFGGNTYYEMNRVPVIGIGTNFTRTNAQGDGYIAQFLTDAGDPNLLNIPGGNWNFETYLSASSSGGSPSFYIELYKFDGSTFTLIASGATESITGGTAIDLYVSAIAVPQTTLLATDRLAVRIFVTTSGRSITLHTEDNNLCQVITTFTTGLTALNGLTAQVQSFATGTAGTDFGISSVGSTHTFDLPTASASNRGALSSTDWSTFNGKQDALVSGTNIKTVNSTTLLGSGDLAVGTVTSVGLTMPAAFSVASSPVIGSGTIAVTGAGTTSQYVRGDGSLATFPTIPVIYKSTTDGTASNAALNTLSASQLVPANTFAVGDTIRVTARARKVGATGNLSLRIYANTSNSLTGATLLGTFVSTGLMIPIQRHLAIKSATNTEGHSATTSLVSDISPSSVAVTSSNIDWTQAQYIIFAVQNGASTDSSLISYYTIEKI